jgi:hypothetical protein
MTRKSWHEGNNWRIVEEKERSIERNTDKEVRDEHHDSPDPDD